MDEHCFAQQRSFVNKQRVSRCFRGLHVRQFLAISCGLIHMTLGCIDIVLSELALFLPADRVTLAIVPSEVVNKTAACQTAAKAARLLL